MIVHAEDEKGVIHIMRFDKVDKEKSHLICAEGIENVLSVIPTDKKVNCKSCANVCEDILLYLNDKVKYKSEIKKEDFTFIIELACGTRTRKKHKK